MKYYFFPHSVLLYCLLMWMLDLFFSLHFIVFLLLLLLFFSFVTLVVHFFFFATRFIYRYSCKYNCDTKDTVGREKKFMVEFPLNKTHNPNTILHVGGCAEQPFLVFYVVGVILFSCMSVADWRRWGISFECMCVCVQCNCKLLKLKSMPPRVCYGITELK